ncbi:MAG: hypothetical protein IIZ59_01550 [Clostridia bacterium]|nr:hypothetical protein [Clostridia bacterium]
MNSYEYGMDEYSAFGIAMLITGGVILFCGILMIVAYWRIFTKAGRPGWHAIIPFLNTYDLYEISWSKTMAGAMLICSFVGGFIGGFASSFDSSVGSGILDIVYAAICILTLIQLYFLSESFGHGVPFFIGLLFLTPIFLLILAFDGSVYRGSFEMRKAAGQYQSYQQNTPYQQYPQYPQQNPYQQYPDNQPKTPYQQYQGVQQKPYNPYNPYNGDIPTPPQNNPFENGGNY